eukprot:4894164-Pyramimonas_sp.AAC.1
MWTIRPLYYVVLTSRWAAYTVWPVLGHARWLLWRWGPRPHYGWPRCRPVRPPAPRCSATGCGAAALPEDLSRGPDTCAEIAWR